MSHFTPILLPKLISSAQVTFPNSQWPFSTNGSKLRSKILKLLKSSPELMQLPAFYPLHNHIDKSLSVIYYRIIDNTATISAVGEGTTALKQYLSTFFEVFGAEKEFFQFYHFDYQEHFEPIGFLASPISYLLTDWLPFSKREGINFKKEFDKCQTEEQQKEVLRLLLKDQILALLRRLEYDAVYQINIEISLVPKPVIVEIEKKEVTLKFSMFSELYFRTNFLLPPHVAFGEHTSIGFGSCSVVK